MELSVIIVNYNVKYFLEQCLCSVLNACRNIEAEIIVVDNNSTDGSREYLEPKFPGVTFIWSRENAGFAKANNSALKNASGNNILFLNPDTLVAEDCFEKCLVFSKAAKGFGALGVHMIDGTGKFLKESKRSFPSPATSFFKMAGFAALFPSSKLFAGYYAGHLDEKQDHEVAVLAGAFMMIKKEVLEKVNGFDENYFMYGEDIDLSYRVQQAGYKNYYFAGTTIIHFKGESTQKNSYDYIRTFYAAMSMFVNKHYKDKRLTVFLMKLSIWFSRMLALLVLFFRGLLSHNIQSTKAVNTAVVAGQQRFDQVIHLMRFSAIPLTIKGRIAVDPQDTGIMIGRLEAIDKSIVTSGIEQLLFCEGELSYKKIIETVQHLSARTVFLFHASGCSSIVGSNNKNTKGIFIAK